MTMAAPVDVAAIGETMVAFVSQRDDRNYLAVTAGAESNVAAGVAALGRRARWVSRLGDDHLGRFVAAEVAGRGVDVAAVVDPDRPTGVMTKLVRDGTTERSYHRRGSAASALSRIDLDRVGVARWVHVTGITPALSESAAELVEAVVDRFAGTDTGVALDVNLRAALWPSVAVATETLLPVARRADLVFVGDDEADALFGTSDASALGALLLEHDGQELVLKRGAGPASVVAGDTVVSEPALAAAAIDLTGAGDAFAAGYLTARCAGWAPRARLRLGHLMAARVIGIVEDVVPPFTTEELASLTPEGLTSRWGDARS